MAAAAASAISNALKISGFVVDDDDVDDNYDDNPPRVFLLGLLIRDRHEVAHAPHPGGVSKRERRRASYCKDCLIRLRLSYPIISIGKE